MKTTQPKTKVAKRPLPKSKKDDVHLVSVLADGSTMDALIQYGTTTVCDTRMRSVVVAGDLGNVEAGERGSAIAGFGSTAKAGTDGLAYVFHGSARCTGHRGIAITLGGGTAQAVDSLAVTHRGGHAIMEGAGIAIAINEKTSLDATAQAGKGGLIILGYRATENGPTIYVTRVVDGVIIAANTPYKLDKTFLPVPACICGSETKPKLAAKNKPTKR